MIHYILIYTFSEELSFQLPCRKGIVKEKFLAFSQFFPNNKYLLCLITQIVKLFYCKKHPIRRLQYCAENPPYFFAKPPHVGNSMLQNAKS